MSYSWCYDHGMSETINWISLIWQELQSSSKVAGILWLSLWHICHAACYRQTDRQTNRRTNSHQLSAA